MEVVALYRYPVKGCTPEWLTEAKVLASGRITGDRTLAFLLEEPEQPVGWLPKRHFLSLVNTPALARLRFAYDAGNRRLRIERGPSLIVDDLVDGRGRARINRAVAEELGRSVWLVGDGDTPQFQDSSSGRVSLHGRASLRALAAAASVPEIDERRFRSNVAIDGAGAWQEHEWAGRRLRIGEVDFEVVKVVERCVATHVDPDRGARNLQLLTAMTETLGQRVPIFAIEMLPHAGGGTIRMGDRVSLHEGG